jgi:hypothetical protein
MGRFVLRLDDLHGPVDRIGLSHKATLFAATPARRKLTPYVTVGLYIHPYASYVGMYGPNSEKSMLLESQIKQPSIEH